MLLENEVASRLVKVSGGPGRDPDVDTWEIKCRIDYSMVTRDELIRRAYKNDVINLQNNKLRPLTVAELDQLAKTGYSCNGNEVADGKRAVVNVMAKAQANFAEMSAEEQKAFIEALQRVQK